MAIILCQAAFTLSKKNIVKNSLLILIFQGLCDILIWIKIWHKFAHQERKINHGKNIEGMLIKLLLNME